MIISVLLIQDLIAIIILLMLQGYGKNDQLLLDITMQILTLPLLILISWFFERYVIVKLINRFDQIHEYIFLLAMLVPGHCGGGRGCWACRTRSARSSRDYPGFQPDRPVHHMKLKPLRDFFLVLFFFSLGASFNLDIVSQIVLPAAALAICALIIKPIIFEKLFVKAHENGQYPGKSGTGWDRSASFPS